MQFNFQAMMQILKDPGSGFGTFTFIKGVRTFPRIRNFGSSNAEFIWNKFHGFPEYSHLD